MTKPQIQAQFQIEAKILCTINKPKILKFFGYSWNQNYGYLVMEYFNSNFTFNDFYIYNNIKMLFLYIFYFSFFLFIGDLHSVLLSSVELSWPQRINIAYQIALGIFFLFSQINLIHNFFFFSQP